VKLSQVGEFRLIDLLARQLGKPSRGVVVGIGDDAAAIQVKSQKSKVKTNVSFLLITTDTLVENIHFKLRKASFYDLGYKALAVNVSDVAAMGGVPTYALVTVGANKNLSVKKVQDLYRGISRAARKFRVEVIGGDTVQSPKELIVSITLLGEVEKKHLLTRSKAKVGDVILVTGEFGGPAAVKYDSRKQKVERRTQEARIIAKSRMATSMIDSSDGLVRSVLEICKASKVGARIRLDSVPVAKKAVLEQALYGGEEYELVFTTSLTRAAELKAAIEKKTRTKVAILGEIVAKNKGIKLVDEQGRDSALKKSGYEHFK